MSGLDWLSDEAWEVLEPHLPENRPGAPRVDDRRVISRFSLAFSASRALRRRASDTAIPPGSTAPGAGRSGNSDPACALPSPRHDVMIATRVPEDRLALVWREYERTT